MIKEITRILIIILLTISATTVPAAEPKPSFPDRSMKLVAVPYPKVQPTAHSRLTAIPDTPIPPFSWDQTYVIREGGGATVVIQAFDPNFNPVSVVKQVSPEVIDYTLDPESNFTDFGTVKAILWDRKANRLTFNVPLGNGALTDTLLFRTHVGGFTDDIAYPLNIEIRKNGDGRKIFAKPTLFRSEGLVTAPGHFVRMKWNKQSGGGTDQKWRVEISGKTGAAANLSNLPDSVTDLQAFRFRPLVLGHYVALVTPWDTEQDLFEQRRGTTSNGAIVHCRFGSENLAPVSNGLTASTFTPAVGENVTGIEPIATDPETARSEIQHFNGNTINFGDGTGSLTFDGTTTHTFSTPGLYKATCTIQDLPVPNPPNSDIDPGPDGLTSDLFAVGSTAIPASGKGAKSSRLTCAIKKEFTEEDAGAGIRNKDTLTMTWSDVSANAGDRIVFCFNRNRFGRMHTDPDPADGEIDDRIVLNAQKKWSGSTPLAEKVTVTSSKSAIKITVLNADLDNTADVRFGGAEREGETSGHLIAICIIPSSFPSEPILTFHMNRTDLMVFKVKGGNVKKSGIDPELSISAKTAPGP